MKDKKPLGHDAPAPDLADVWDQDILRKWLKTAKRLERDDVYKDAFRQLCGAEKRETDDPLELEFAGVICALEQALTEGLGKTKRLSPMRLKLGRSGVVKTMSDLVSKPTATDGFAELQAVGMGEFSAENLVLKHEGRFEPGVIAAAKARLAEQDTAPADA